jgi:uncharacterized Zn ribbon protein
MHKEDYIKLQELLGRYKASTEDVISAVENEEVERFEACVENRQRIIEDISLLSYEKEDFAGICKDLNIIGLQQRLNSLVEVKKVQLKNKVSEISEKKNANKSYMNSSNTFNRNFFNTKV